VGSPEPPVAIVAAHVQPARRDGGSTCFLYDEPRREAIRVGDVIRTGRTAEVSVDQGPRRPAGAWRTRGKASLVLDVLIALVLPVFVTSAMYLFPFVRNPSLLPFGSDTKKYLARAEIVKTEGIQGLDEDHSSIAERPTVPVFVATITGLTRSTPLTYAWLTPAIFASLIALAAGALASEGLEESRRRSIFYGVAVGCSAFVAWTAYGYAANLLVDPVIVALFLVAILATTTGRGRFAGALLLAGAVLAHWVFASLAAGLLVGLAILLALARLLHGSMRPRKGAARDVALIVVGGLAGGAAAMGLAPSFPSRISVRAPGSHGGTFHLDQRLPGMRLPITGPLAGLGFVLGLIGPRRQRRWCLVLLALWALLVPIALVGWYVFDLSTTPYRFAAFALAIPLLVVTAAGSVGTFVRNRLPRLGVVVGGALLLAASAGLAATGASVWWKAQPHLNPDELSQLEILAAYLAPQSPDLQVIVPIPPQMRLSMDRIRVGLPVELASRVRTLPILLDPREPNGGIVVPDRTAVVWLDAFEKRAVPGEPLGPGVVLVNGPPPAGPIIPRTPPRAPPVATMVVLVLAAIGALAAAGSGWAQLLDISPIGRAALMPAFGVATLGPVGLVLSRAGVPFDTWGGAIIVLSTAATGWVAVVARRLRPPSSPPQSPTDEPPADPIVA
jgi:hypothetical protein